MHYMGPKGYLLLCVEQNIAGCLWIDSRKDSKKAFLNYDFQGCLVQVGNGIELEAVGLQFEPYRWRPCGVTWDLSRTVVVMKLRRTSALPELIYTRCPA